MMLNVITDIFKPNEKVDSLFGVLKFRRAFLIIGTGYWDGEAHFEPLGKTVNVHITAGKSDALKTEREFYRQIEQHYPEIIGETLGVLYDTILNYYGSFFHNDTREEILADCELDAVILPSAKNPDSEWSLSFMYMLHKETYSIYFDGWKPIYGLLDD
jgi:hypothetical protein